MGQSTKRTSEALSYLSVEDIIKIHDIVLTKYGGGEPGIYPTGRDTIKGIIDRMKTGFFGYQPFETLLQKVAFQFQSILQYHPFIDGLKRTGIYASLAFFLKNDYVFYSKGVDETVKFSIRVADEMAGMDANDALDEIVSWFKERVFPLKDEIKISNYAQHQHATFKCPKCAGESTTIDSPFCKDCGSQLISFKIIIDGVVVRKVIEFKRKIVPLSEIVPTQRPHIGLYK